MSDVEDADAVAVLGEGGEEMGVVRGGGEAEEGWGVRHGLLGCGGRDVAGAVGSWARRELSCRCWDGSREWRGLTFVNFLAWLVDDGAVFETSKIEHSDTTICAA